MNPLGDFLIGFSYPWRALRLLLNKRYRRLIWVPVVITMVVLSSTLTVVALNFQEWTTGILPGWLAFLEWLLLPMLILVVLVAYYFTFVQVANLIASPFNARLCQVIMQESANEPLGIQTIPRSHLHSALRAVGREVLKFITYLMCFIGLGILFLLPLIGLLFAPLLIYFYIYWAAFEYLDYPMSEVGLPLPEVRKKIRAQRPLMLGFGAGQALLTLIPILNLVAVPSGAAAATRLYLEQRLLD